MLDPLKRPVTGPWPTTGTSTAISLNLPRPGTRGVRMHRQLAGSAESLRKPRAMSSVAPGHASACIRDELTLTPAAA